MLLIKQYFLSFLLFSILNFIYVNELEPFQNVLLLLVPFDVNKGILIGRAFVFTLSLNLILLNLLYKYVDEQFNMLNFILPRLNNKRISFKLTTYILKKIGIILTLKLLADLLFSRMSGFENFDLFLILTFSTLVTCIIWNEILFLSKLYHAPTTVTFLTLVAFITICIIFGSSFSILTLFVPATMSLLNSPLVWLSAKLILLIALISMKACKMRSYDYLGVSNDD